MIMTDIEVYGSYLPWGLKVIRHNNLEYGLTVTGVTLSELQLATARRVDDIIRVPWLHSSDNKPILRSLRTLDKSITENGNLFLPVDEFKIGGDDNHMVDYGRGTVRLNGLLKDMATHNFIHFEYLNYGIILKLLQWHFDIYGWIEQGKAIDVAMLPKNPYAEKQITQKTT